jgi:hypothetical protein
MDKTYEKEFLNELEVVLKSSTINDLRALLVSQAQDVIDFQKDFESMMKTDDLEAALAAADRIAARARGLAQKTWLGKKAADKFMDASGIRTALGIAGLRA